MTSLLPSPRARAERQPNATGDDLRHRRPLALMAFAGGILAAASTLVVLLAIGVLGWFLTGGGALRARHRR